MGLLEEAASWLNTRREECLSVPIQYQFRSGGSAELTATVGRTLFRAEDQ